MGKVNCRYNEAIPQSNHLVIVGGGFGGLYATKTLQTADLQVILV
jgi:NADH dehydrogenase FAD-containing subunit